MFCRGKSSLSNNLYFLIRNISIEKTLNESKMNIILIYIHESVSGLAIRGRALSRRRENILQGKSIGKRSSHVDIILRNRQVEK